jgi:Uma2 family endonuclease
MTIEVERPTLTREEFFALQELREGEVRGYEYEAGKLIPMSLVNGPQSSAWTDLAIELGYHVKHQKLGRTWLDIAVYLDRQGRRRYFPDIVYLSNDDLRRYDGEVIIGPPTLVVEVANKRSRQRDRGPKKRAYHAAGVPWYWIVDVVAPQIEEYRWAAEGYELVSATPFDGTFTPQLFLGLSLSGIPV